MSHVKRVVPKKDYCLGVLLENGKSLTNRIY